MDYIFFQSFGSSLRGKPEVNRAPLASKERRFSARASASAKDDSSEEKNERKKKYRKKMKKRGNEVNKKEKYNRKSLQYLGYRSAKCACTRTSPRTLSASW